MKDHLLAALVALPLFAALVVALLPRAGRSLVRPVAMLASFAELGLAGYLLRGEYPRGRPGFVESYGWIGDSGVHLTMAVDGISLPLVLLTAVLVPIAMHVSFPEDESRARMWAGGVLVMEAALVGAFVARDLVFFYVCWELVLLPLYLFIAMQGGAKALTSNRFFLYTLAGSLGMLLAMLYAGAEYASHSGSGPSFLLADLERLAMPFDAQVACFVAFALAFAIKIPLVPLHSWSPETYRDAPTGAAILAAGAMAKLGTYGLIRIAIPLFPLGSQFVGASIAVLAVVAILYGALVAMRQDDMRMLLAYSSMSHMGFVVLGIFAMTSVSVAGATFQMVSHGLSTAALFLVVEAIERRTGSRRISELSGLAGRAPVLARVFVMAALAAVAIPTTAGFVGETMILSGAFGSEGFVGFGSFGPSFAAFAALGLVLGAVYVLSLVQRVLFGQPNERATAIPEADADLRPSERLSIGTLVLLSFGLGIFPTVLLEAIEPSANAFSHGTMMRWEAMRNVEETTVVAPSPAPSREDPDSDGEAGADAPRADTEDAR